jgi:phage terminase large subunit-like protein
VSQYARFALRAVRPEADKFTRALAWAARAEEGKVILVRGPGPTYPTAANRFGIHNIPRRLDGLGHESFTGLRRNPDVYTMGQNRPGLEQNASNDPVNIAGRSTNTTDPLTANNPNWIEDFLEEICSFPNSPHDDQLDAVSTAIQMMEGQRRIARAF